MKQKETSWTKLSITLIIAATILSAVIILSTRGIKIYHEIPKTGEYPKEIKEVQETPGKQETVRKEERRENVSVIVKRGLFMIVDGLCKIEEYFGGVEIIATYSGDAATLSDIQVKVRNKLTGTTYTSTPHVVYKGPSCTLVTAGQTGCNTQVSVTTPIVSGERVAIGVLVPPSYISAGTPVDIELVVFGQPSGTYSVTCY